MTRIQETLDKLVQSHASLEARLMEKIGNLEKLLQEKNDTIRKLEDRIDDLEQYSRKEDVIVTGLTIQRTFAEAVAGESEDRPTDTTEEQTIKFFTSHGIDIREEEISACHTLGKRRDDGTQKVIIRFVSRKSKVKLLRNARKLKGTNVYVNEHLTTKTGGLAKKARDLKREKKIESTWVRDCKVFLKKMDGKVLRVTSMDTFDEL